jgi:hypothetical protein
MPYPSVLSVVEELLEAVVDGLALSIYCGYATHYSKLLRERMSRPKPMTKPLYQRLQ